MSDRDSAIDPAMSAAAHPGSDPLANYLRSLPRLRHRGAAPIPSCKMCGAPSEDFCAVDFNVACNGAEVFERSHVLVPYVRCMSCDFLFTSIFDSWTPRDFADRETEFVLRFVNVIDQSFLDRIQLRVGSECLPMRRRRSRLHARYVPAEPGTFPSR